MCAANPMTSFNCDKLQAAHETLAPPLARSLSEATSRLLCQSKTHIVPKRRVYPQVSLELNEALQATCNV